MSDRELIVAHQHPGRLRVRSSAFERDPDLLRRATEAASREAGVRSAVATPTGSVLVEYDCGRIDAAALVAAIARAASLVLAPPRAVRPARSLARAAYDVAREVDESVAAWSRGRYDLRVTVPLAMGVGSVASFVWSRHLRAPRWDNLLYWGYQLFRMLNDERVADSDGDDGRDAAR